METISLRWIEVYASRRRFLSGADPPLDEELLGPESLNGSRSEWLRCFGNR
jgi:hypothetical protein